MAGLRDRAEEWEQFRETSTIVDCKFHKFWGLTRTMKYDAALVQVRPTV